MILGPLFYRKGLNGAASGTVEQPVLWFNSRSMSRWFWIIGLSLLITLPFLEKAFHIDDPFVLRVAENILQDYARPLAGQIDWLGSLRPIFEVTTNPPGLSYWLAPWLGLFGPSEVVLHLAIIPFYILLAWAVWELATQMGLKDPRLALAFTLLTPAVVVSGNVMRDVPAAATGLAALALFWRGCSQGRLQDRLLAALLAAASGLLKYWGVVVLAPMLVCILLYRRYLALAWLLLPAGALLLWSLQNWLVMGRVHIVYLLQQGGPGAVEGWEAHSLMVLVILGSSVLLWIRIPTGRELISSLVLFIIAVSFWSLTFGGFPDAEQCIWLLGGSCLVTRAGAALSTGGRDRILLVLGLSILSFSVFIVPFQAVRHLLMLLPVVVIAYLKKLETDGSLPGPRFLVVLLLLQGGLAFSVQLADTEYAATYRNFARDFSPSVEERKVWFVGHWGWMHYAREEGFHQLHGNGPQPEIGDLLIWPEKVHIGHVFTEPLSLEQVAESSVAAEIPIRTMSIPDQAAFYATIRGRIPYRLGGGSPLEVFRVYEVANREGANTQKGR